MKGVAIYPGSFDPVTLGHIDIIERASKVFDTVIIGVLDNSKKTPLFSAEERVNILKKVSCHISNVKVDSFSGLLVDYARKTGADVIVRGLRAVSDFEYELQMAQTNHQLDPEIDTIFFTTTVEYAYLSSSTVREIASLGGNVDVFLSPEAAKAVYAKYEKLF